MTSAPTSPSVRRDLSLDIDILQVYADLLEEISQQWEQPQGFEILKLLELGVIEYQLASRRYVNRLYATCSQIFQAEAVKILGKTETIAHIIANFGLKTTVSTSHFFVAFRDMLHAKRLIEDGSEMVLFEIFDPCQHLFVNIPFDTKYPDIPLTGAKLISILEERSPQPTPPGAIEIWFSTSDENSSNPDMNRSTPDTLGLGGGGIIGASSSNTFGAEKYIKSSMFNPQYPPVGTVLSECRRAWLWSSEYEFCKEGGDDVLSLIVNSVVSGTTDPQTIGEDAYNDITSNLLSDATCALMTKNFPFSSDEPAPDEERRIKALKVALYIAYEANLNDFSALRKWGNDEYCPFILYAIEPEVHWRPQSSSIPLLQTPPALVGPNFSASPTTTPEDSKKSPKSPAFLSSPVLQSVRERIRFPSLSPRWSQLKSSVTQLLSPRFRSPGNSPSSTTGKPPRQQSVPDVFSDQGPPLGQGLGLKNVDLGPLFPLSICTPPDPPSAELSPSKDPNAQDSRSPKTPTQKTPVDDNVVVALIRNIISPLVREKRKREPSHLPGPSATPTSRECPPEKQPKVEEQLEPSSHDNPNPRRRSRARAEDLW